MISNLPQGSFGHSWATGSEFCSELHTPIADHAQSRTTTYGPFCALCKLLAIAGCRYEYCTAAVYNKQYLNCIVAVLQHVIKIGTVYRSTRVYVRPWYR